MNCDKCGKQYSYRNERWCKWCKSCQIDHLKKNFTNWTSGNEKIDYLIQEMQLKLDYKSIVFEWIPYIQFNEIKKLGEYELYSAIWKDGPLHYVEYDSNDHKYEYVRNQHNTNVTLKYLQNSNIITGEFLNEV
jgi:hypothetical protein